MFNVKKVNRILLSISISISVILLQGCSNEFDISSASETKSIQEANTIAAEYVELVNNQYVLNLSENEAVALGISKSDYNRMQKEVFQVNLLILEYQTKGLNIELNDPSNIHIERSYLRLRSQGEGNNDKPNIYFIMPPTGAGGTGSAFAPNGVKSVTIRASMGCLIGSFYGTVKCGGQQIPFSAAGFSGGSTTVNLPMSNTNVTITANTACSFGGSISATFNY